MIRFLEDMGIRYAIFRIWHEIQVRTGLLTLRFPVDKKHLPSFSREKWLDQKIQFVFDPADLNLKKDPSLSRLQERAAQLRQNKFLYFHDQWRTVSDWHTNPENGFIYEKNTHWSKIPTLSKQAGDIKYVWEKSRFCFLFDLLRYDFHFKNDHSRVVFAFISDWIDQNPVNRGPNWCCGQEISLRALNWTFAIHYYKNSETLSSALFNKIVQSIYEQMRRVAKHIPFSRTAVRNNHALTETLALYVIGTFFPHFPESGEWKRDGKKWFEEEIGFQVYEDGTFLQFSMNYHRVVVQLLTFAISIAKQNGDKWADIVYDRAKKSLHFLRSCQDEATGWLPNYGNNDGALFFPLTECHFRDFRPQLQALANILNLKLGYEKGPWIEEAAWFNLNFHRGTHETFQPKPVTSFEQGGYYMIRETQTLTFLRCGAYKNRPFQADNMHLDIWANGVNILRDAGSYSYNTDEKWLRYFAGTASHNTVMLGDFDQMRKGPRFMWFNWIKRAKAFVDEDIDSFYIHGEFEGFQQLGKGIKHQRSVTKLKEKRHWIIEDHIENRPDYLPMHQIWHPHPDFFQHYVITAEDNHGNEIKLEKTEGWHSETYGKKVACGRLVFASFGNYIRTVIQAKSPI
ncbi:alginate lyase family protein [Dyadobacter sp. CY347]|uniref:alginate lyase family protein n=1 Tax=Dyadobacter sp. CY347 TaxID=2909336 RepID=UPI001F2FEFEF|nr:alginate lyase family protein [Dyadobacter sp. CY347]MCF2489723.1 heparinase II/III family protein [Dyadobacter sp. CY347]